MNTISLNIGTTKKFLSDSEYLKSCGKEAYIFYDEKGERKWGVRKIDKPKETCEIKNK